MPKVLFTKKLVYLNFLKEEFRFYDIEVLSVGYNKIQVISTHGKLGTKGRSSIVRFENVPDAYKEGTKLAYKKIFEKKDEGFHSIDKVAKLYEDFAQEEYKNRFKKTTKKIQKDEPSFPISECLCDVCKKPIKPTQYHSIKTWARGEGNWDHSKTFVGYKKVLCISCQVEHDIFKKKF